MSTRPHSAGPAPAAHRVQVRAVRASCRQVQRVEDHQCRAVQRQRGRQLPQVGVVAEVGCAGADGDLQPLQFDAAGGGDGSHPADEVAAAALAGEHDDRAGGVDVVPAEPRGTRGDGYG